MGKVVLKNVSHKFNENYVLKNINIEIEDGELFTLLGPSGCGKTTMLRIIAGFIKPTKGNVFLGAEDITELPAEKRNIGTVFQNYALFPNMNVEENIAYGLKIKKLSKNEVTQRVKHYLELVGMYQYRKRKITELSGGQQQRVALVRSMSVEPNVLLLDEPMSNLDASLREKMREEIRALQQKLKITTLFITHDQREALAISDRIAVLNDGECIQIGSPTEIYSNPQSTFVANFVGESNIFDGNEIKGSGIENIINKYELTNRKIMIRPEAVTICDFASDCDDKLLEGFVEKVTYNGSTIEYTVKAENLSFKIISLNTGNQKNEQGSKVLLKINENAIRIV